MTYAVDSRLSEGGPSVWQQLRSSSGVLLRAIIASSLVFWWLDHRSVCMHREIRTCELLKAIEFRLLPFLIESRDDFPNTNKDVIALLEKSTARDGPPNNYRKLIEQFTDAWGNELRVVDRGANSVEIVSAGVNRKFDVKPHDDISVLITISDKGFESELNTGWPEFRDGESRFYFYFPIRFYISVPSW